MCLKKYSLFFVAFLFLANLTVSAQKKYVQGKITAFDNIPVEQAVVTVKKTQVSVLTNALGIFTIECELKDKLNIRAAGLESKTIKIKSLDDVLDIKLELSSDVSDIDVAIEKGHLNQNNRAQAIKYFNTKNSFGYGYTNMLDLIQGKFPQVSISGDDILIRGTNSLNSNNNAMIVLDGNISTVGSIKSIVVTEVEDIKILSGTAAARYGTGNGVIAIRLKSLKE